MQRDLRFGGPRALKF